MNRLFITLLTTCALAFGVTACDDEAEVETPEGEGEVEVETE